jgi:integrase/recombinase XerD
MFERLYARPIVLTHHTTSPLAEERIAYLRHLEGRGASKRSLCDIAAYLLVITERLNLANRRSESISVDEIKQQATDWAKRVGGHTPGESSRETFLLHARQWLDFLDRLVPPAPIQRTDKPFAEQIKEFATYLHTEKGLSPVTVRSRCRVMHRLLAQLTTSENLSDITIGRIDELLLGMVKGGSCARTSAQSYAGTMRSFFRYAEMRAWCRKGLATAIAAPRVYSQTAVPAGPSWDEVRQLIAESSGDQPEDIRDRAIIMLLAVYGLRTGDLTSLRLEDIDWDHETLLVRSPKNRQTRTYPLARPVGDAILRYLQEVRPRSRHRELFLTHLPPIRPFTRVNAAVAKRMRRMGLAIPHPGPHALRHACATHLLAQGLSLKEIGDYLGVTSQ